MSAPTVEPEVDVDLAALAALDFAVPCEVRSCDLVAAWVAWVRPLPCEHVEGLLFCHPHAAQRQQAPGLLCVTCGASFLPRHVTWRRIP